MQKKILVFGANGFVGMRLIKKAILNGYSVIGYDKKSESYKHADITNKLQVEEVFKLEKPDAVINVAAISDIDFADKNRDLAWDINVNGAQNLAFLCRKYNAKYVYFSSDAVFSGNDAEYSEDSNPEPVNYYGYTKKEAENIVLKTCPLASVIRISLVLGFPIHTGNSFYLKLKQTLENNMKLEFPLDEFRTPIDVDTLCESVLELAESSISGILHLGSTDSKNRYEIASMFAEKAGLNKNLIIPIPHVVASGKAPRHKNGILNTQKAQQLLKTKFLSVEKFIEKSLNQL